MQIFKFSAKTFNGIGDIPFSKTEYSKFKHGSKRVGRIFGKELALQFLKSKVYEQLILISEKKEVVICSAPYKYIPVASTLLKDYFYSEFNNEWSETRSPIIDLKVFRGHSYNDDYGSMAVEGREAAINADDFHIDKEFIKDKILLFIDDIRITGSHEKRIIKLLEKNEFNGKVFFIYYAELNSNTNAHPNIENELNYAFVESLLDINSIIKDDEFIFNTRVVKFILNSKSIEFKAFISFQSKVFQKTLLTYLQGNNYHKIDSFRRNYEHLIEILKQKA
jgi:hypothetical protein